MATIDEVVVKLKNIVAGFDFTRTGTDQSLGRDLAKLMAEKIASRAAQGFAPDGTPWPPNSTTEPPTGGYKARKLREYGWDNPNFRTGQMLSRTNLYGRTTITPHLVTMIYGLNVTPTIGSPINGRITERDKMVTDTQKATWAHTGGAHGKKRPFYAIGQGDLEAVVDLCQKSLNKYLKEKW